MSMLSELATYTLTEDITHTSHSVVHLTLNLRIQHNMESKKPYGIVPSLILENPKERKDKDVYQLNKLTM